MLNPLWFAAFYGISEVVISSVLRSKTQSKATDKGSLAMLWMTINVSMLGGIGAFINLPGASFGETLVFYWSGLMVFAFGIALRWYAIAYLGRFFTVDVAVASDQTVVATGPYRHIRHPSYTGALLAFAGLALMFANYVSLLFFTIPITTAFLLRIRVEEAALEAGLGEPYRRYMERTKRLIPFVY